MSKTLNELNEYLNLLEIPNEDIRSFLNKKEIRLYCYLRDHLTYSEILELTSILKDITNNLTNYKNVNFKRFINLNSDNVKRANSILNFSLEYNKDILLALSTIIIEEPKDIILNFYNNF
jgi:hypothetical protein